MIFIILRPISSNKNKRSNMNPPLDYKFPALYMYLLTTLTYNYGLKTLISYQAMPLNKFLAPCRKIWGITAFTDSFW